MTQPTKSKTINTIPLKGVVNKPLNNTSKKKRILKSAASRAPQKDFTIDDLHQNQQQELSKRRYEKELKKLFLKVVTQPAKVVSSNVLVNH